MQDTCMLKSEIVTNVRTLANIQNAKFDINNSKKVTLNEKSFITTLIRYSMTNMKLAQKWIICNVTQCN